MTAAEKLTEKSRLEMLKRIGEATGEDVSELEKLTIEDLSAGEVATLRAVDFELKKDLGADEIDPEVAELESRFPKTRKSWKKIASRFDAWGFVALVLVSYGLYKASQESKLYSEIGKFRNDLADVKEDNLAKAEKLYERDRQLRRLFEIEKKNQVVSKAMEQVCLVESEEESLRSLELAWTVAPDKRPGIFLLFWKWAFNISTTDPALLQSATATWSPRWTEFGNDYQRTSLDDWSAWKLQDIGQSKDAFGFLDRSLNTRTSELDYRYSLKFLEILESVDRPALVPKVLEATKANAEHEIEVKIAAAEIYQRSGMIDEGRELVASLPIEQFNGRLPIVSHLQLQERLLLLTSGLAMPRPLLETNKAFASNVHQFQDVAADAFGEQQTQVWCGLFDLGTERWSAALSHFDKGLGAEGNTDRAFVKSLREVAKFASLKVAGPEVAQEVIKQARIEQGVKQIEAIEDPSIRGAVLTMMSAVASLKGSNIQAGVIARNAVKTIPEGPVKQILMPQLTLNLAIASWAEGDREAAVRLARESRELAIGVEVQKELDAILERFRFGEVADESVLAAASRVFSLVPQSPLFALRRPPEDEPTTPPKLETPKAI